jgi:hypothetical protein
VLIRTIIRDCLQVNWALPEEALAPPPEPLRYEIHRHEDRRWVFASALLFRNEGLSMKGIPGMRLSYPQLNLRFNVLDAEAVPSVLFAAILVPSWVVPAARVVARQRARPGLFQFPSNATFGPEEAACWSVRRRRALEIRARTGAAMAMAEPRVGDWERTVKHFRGRERGYYRTGHGLRRIEASYRSVPAHPVAAEVVRHGLLHDAIPLREGAWPAVHSAWLCPEIPSVFEWGELPETALRPAAPAPG